MQAVNEVLKVLIVGAGPAGLSVAALLREKDIPCLLVDRKGKPGGAYRDIYAKMQLASPSKFLSLPGYALKHKKEYIKAAEYLDYLTLYAEHHKLKITQASVSKIKMADNGFKIKFQEPGKSDILSRQVVLATGMFDTPVWPEDINIESTENDKQEDSKPGPVVLHAHDYKGCEHWLDKRILIIGGASSAVEIAEEIASKGTKVEVSTRQGSLKSIPQRLLGKDVHNFLVPLAYLPNWMLRHYCRQSQPDVATRIQLKTFQRQHLVELVGCCKKIIGRMVYFEDGTTKSYDVIVFATGYRFDYSYLLLGVTPDEALATFNKGESLRWPGLYLMGRGCVFGKPSQFIWGIAHDAKLIARKIENKNIKEKS